MGFLNMARDLLAEHGRTGLLKLRQTGKIVAPTLTRRVGKAVHKNRRLLDAVSGSLGQAINVADAAAVGDLAGGLHAGVHLGQSVGQVFATAKRGARVPKRKATEMMQTKPKRVKQDNSTLDNFDSNVANDPKISGDLLARMTKSTRTS